jgi:hypothetical protein
VKRAEGRGLRGERYRLAEDVNDDFGLKSKNKQFKKKHANISKLGSRTIDIVYCTGTV